MIIKKIKGTIMEHEFNGEIVYTFSLSSRRERMKRKIYSTLVLRLSLPSLFNNYISFGTRRKGENGFAEMNPKGEYYILADPDSFRRTREWCKKRWLWRNEKKVGWLYGIESKCPMNERWDLVSWVQLQEDHPSCHPSQPPVSHSSRSSPLFSKRIRIEFQRT